MELSDLMIFKTVVQEGGVVKAAQKLHRVQSNVTTRIKQLEASIGAPLFIRDRRRMMLSPKGETLLGYAEKLLQLAEEARLAVSEQPPAGLLRLGALESTSASRLPDVLARFHKAYPDIRVELQTGTNDALTADVAARRLDAAFVAEIPVDRGLTAVPVFRENLVLITALGRGEVNGPQDVRDATVIAFPSGCAYRRVFERWHGRRGFDVSRVFELGSYHAIVACVASGTGIALAPESVLDAVKSEGVMRHPLPKVLSEVVTPLIWRTGEATPPVVALRELLTVESAPPRRARKQRGSDGVSPQP